MRDDLAFACHDLGKCFRIPTATSGRRLPLPWRRPTHLHWAVRHLDLEVARGEVLGLVGANGAGKSTLLRLMTRIMHPTEGSFTARGRVAAMLEVGAGFHYELTGRENVFLSGTLLGMSRREVAARLDEIVAFSGVEEYIDTPIKRYSSGMYVRLGFAVASHLDAELLLVDEILAVADAAFRQQCLERLRATAARGTAIVFVSHAQENVRTLCDRAVLLEGGAVAAHGTPDEVLQRYQPVADAPS